MRQRDHFQKQTFLYPAEAECRILRWHVDVLRQMPAVLDSPPQQGWMQFAVHSMPSVLLLLPLSVEWPQSSSWLFSLLMVHAGYVCVAIIHWTLTGTTGSLSCTQMFMHAIACRGVWTPKECLHWKLTLGRKSLAAPWNRTCVSSMTVRWSNKLSYIPSPSMEVWLTDDCLEWDHRYKWRSVCQA